MRRKRTKINCYGQRYCTTVQELVCDYNQRLKRQGIYLEQFANFMTPKVLYRKIIIVTLIFDSIISYRKSIRLKNNHFKRTYHSQKEESNLLAQLRLRQVNQEQILNPRWLELCFLHRTLKMINIKDNIKMTKHRICCF